MRSWDTGGGRSSIDGFIKECGRWRLEVGLWPFRSSTSRDFGRHQTNFCRNAKFVPEIRNMLHRFTVEIAVGNFGTWLRWLLLCSVSSQSLASCSCEPASAVTQPTAGWASGSQTTRASSSEATAHVSRLRVSVRVMHDPAVLRTSTDRSQGLSHVSTTLPDTCSTPALRPAWLRVEFLISTLLPHCTKTPRSPYVGGPSIACRVSTF